MLTQLRRPLPPQSALIEGKQDMLIATPNLPNPDDAYAMLLSAHEGLTKAESDALNARLILVLCNHIGKNAVFQQALTLALGSKT